MDQILEKILDFIFLGLNQIDSVKNRLEPIYSLIKDCTQQYNSRLD